MVYLGCNVYLSLSEIFYFITDDTLVFNIIIAIILGKRHMQYILYFKVCLLSWNISTLSAIPNTKIDTNDFTHVLQIFSRDLIHLLEITYFHYC